MLTRTPSLGPSRLGRTLWTTTATWTLPSHTHGLTTVSHTFLAHAFWSAVHHTSHSVYNYNTVRSLSDARTNLLMEPAKEPAHESQFLCWQCVDTVAADTVACAGFIPDEQQGSFLRSWLDSHLQAAETINKPLLFEEFGKKLKPDAARDVISKLRDPVYEASYEAVESAVEKDRPLLGSLYWKWAVPGLEKGEWGGSGVEGCLEPYCLLGVQEQVSSIQRKLLAASATARQPCSIFSGLHPQGLHATMSMWPAGALLPTLAPPHNKDLTGAHCGSCVQVPMVLTWRTPPWV